MLIDSFIEHIYGHLLHVCGCFCATTEELSQRLFGPQRLKYLLSAPYRKGLPNPAVIYEYLLNLTMCLALPSVEGTVGKRK